VNKKEKIIKGLEECTNLNTTCRKCPYFSYSSCDVKLMEDALGFIKTLYPDKVPKSWKESVMQSFVKVE
jgi:hypothetical protein